MVVIPYQFHPPLGYRVRILRTRGDLIAWPRGVPPPGTYAGILWGLVRTLSGGAADVALSAHGCYIYAQDRVSVGGSRAPFDSLVADGGPLDDDNVLWSKFALYLNDTGLSIHIEASIVSYQYEKENQP